MGRARIFLDSWLNRRESWVWLLGLGLVLRVFVLLLSMDLPLASDALDYHLMAQRLAAGELQDVYWPPGLPLFEAGLIWVFGSGQLVARIAMLFWFAWLGRGTYNLVQRIHSRPAANLALAFLCIYPEFVHHSVEPLTHLPSAALIVAMVNLTLRYTEQGSKRSLGWLGIVLGMLILLRPASLLLAIAVPAYMFLQKRSAFLSLYVMVIALSMAGTWVYLASEANGRFIPVNEANSRNLYLGNNPWTHDYKTWYLGSHWAGEAAIAPGFRQELDRLDALPAEERGAAFIQAARSHIQEAPAKFLLRCANRARVFFAFDSFTGARLHPPIGAHPNLAKLILGLNALLFPFLLIGFGGMLMGAWKREIGGNTNRFIFGVVLAYLLPYIFSFSHPTYHLGVLPLILSVGIVPFALMLFPMGRPFRFPGGRDAWRLWAVFIVVLAVQVEWVVQMWV